MKHALRAFFLTTALIAVSCDDSIYPDFMVDKDSDEARVEDLEIAIDKGDYDYIIKELEGSDYSQMSSRHKYLLQCAWLGASGFSSIEILADILDNPDNINLTALLMGGDSQTLTKAEITTKKGYYSNIVMMNKTYNTEGDTDIKTVAALSSVLGMAMAATEVVTGFPGCSSVSLDANDPNYIGACINGNATVIAGQMDPDELDDYLAAMEDLVASPDLSDEGFKQELQEFIDEIKDPATGSVDATKLAAYLEKAFPATP